MDATDHPGSGHERAMARIVGFGDASAAANAPSSWRSSSADSRPTAMTSSRCMPGSVSVPVLSAHTVSTRASTSTAGRSCTRTRRLASRITETAMAMLVSNTRPSGTIVTTPAMVPRTASFTGNSARISWEVNKSTPTGTRK